MKGLDEAQWARLEAAVGAGLREWSRSLDEEALVRVRGVLAAAAAQIAQRKGARQAARDLAELSAIFSEQARRRTN